MDVRIRGVGSLSVLGPLVLAACAPAASAGPRSPDPHFEQEVPAMTQQLLDSFATGDKSVWERYADDALVYVTEDNEVKSKPQFLLDLQPLPAGFRGTARVADFRATRAGDVLVSTYLVEETEIAYGQTLHARYRTTDTWHLTGAGYRLLSSEVYAVPHDPAATRLPDAALDQYVGSYHIDRSTGLRLRRDGDHLVAEREGRPPQSWIAEAPDVFFSPGRPRTRRIFVRDAAGAVKGFVDRREGEDLVWNRDG